MLACCTANRLIEHDPSEVAIGFHVVVMSFQIFLIESDFVL